MKNKIKILAKGNKKEFIMLGAFLVMSCIGGYIGAIAGIESGFHRQKFEINIIPVAESMSKHI